MSYQYELFDRDGTSLGDITDVCTDRNRLPLLNGPQLVGGKVPSWHELVNATQADGRPVLCEGYRALRVRKNGSIVFNGIVWLCEEDGDENACETAFQAIDPMGAFWPRRLGQDADGDFSAPSFLLDNRTGPQALQAMISNSIANDGELGLDLGTFATGGVDLSAAPVDWPMTIGDVFSKLAATGELDAVVTPLDGTGSSGRVMGRLDAYNGNFGTDRSGTVVFKYAPGTGIGNVSRYKRTGDMSKIANNIWKFLGPKYDDQHWAGNITKDAPAFATEPGPTVIARVLQSRSDLSVFFEFQSDDDEYGNAFRGLHERMWLMESWVRSLPRQVYNVTPSKKGALAPGGYAAFDSDDFGIGDLVGLEVSAKARSATSGAVRVYGIPITIEDDGSETIGDLILSADQEGVSG